MGGQKKVQDVVFLDEEDAQIKETAIDTSDDWGKAKLYYPSRDDPESVELSYCDIKCLEPQQYLSSPIMNFYILYLQRPLSSANKIRGEYYFFNTYFYGKLEEALLKKGDRFSRFQKLRRWWKGVNIFEKAYIFVPIHRDLHWSLAIVSIPPKEDDSCPIILHLDSLSLHNSKQILDVIHCYLTEEWKFMKIASSNIPISDKIWDEVPLKIDKKEIKVPQQKNEYDCGIFVLYFMERFIEGAPERLKRKDLSMFGSQWFQPEDASALRKRIKDLLLKEFESARLEFGREECRESPSSSSESVD
ncbi:hypothetical protein HPP92_008136 [Vanilla planifolia]|uniref:Ubiquitin-like protease family profile domain-containing protein n=1 Tax=Vanilla planifolia TaxID=51239 RepID=A0A835V7M3_VANPL|nr:hypothetical protein HPP92_008136 [Vanilla planifolia]